jgi:redox-sensitive bicupin YhaK (pirin superfamily)
MKKIIARSSAHSENVGSFNMLRALPNSIRQTVGPIIFLDHFPQRVFESNTLPVADGSFAHPHRGIATFTYLVAGELNHFDSKNGRGSIKSGGVQWMNAGNGIIHDEGFTAEFRKEGGSFYGFQFWVNLPAKNKAEPAQYISVPNENLPLISLPGGAGSLKVLLGMFGEQQSPIPMFTDQFIWHIRLNAKQCVTIPTVAHHEYGGYLPSGYVSINNSKINAEEFFVFEQSDTSINIENQANDDLDIFIFGGEPYCEPIVSQGPFVMNSQAEIAQAYSDFHNGKYGEINY